MNFEKLELQGFKSFADKTVIKFEEGITGIVGPNGCGKSNVADAIRWVLGEQSAKTLRGGTMQDVIFNGTENRKSLSYCEVSLYFNNADKHLFDVEYDQVIITRKLFRSGESEYQLNKQPCRLRDIVELLHQCGIGKDGYTVIGQGKVTQIMSSKPEDRRAVFEEATGISQNKSKKAESERRLQRVKEELIRYTDLITEIENQLRPLSRQAEKTKEYNRLSEELKINEVNTYIYKRDSVDSEKKKITDKIEKISKNIKRVTEETEEVKNQNAQAFFDLNDADNKLEKANEKLLLANVEIENKNGQVQVINGKIGFIADQIKTASNDIKENDEYIKNYKSMIEQHNESIVEYENTINNLNKKIENLNTTLAEIEGRILMGDSKTDEIQKKLLDSLANLSDINLSKGSLKGELSGLVARRAELENSLFEMNSKREKYFADKDNCDKLINDCDRRIYEIKNSVSDKEDLIHSLNEKISEVSSKIYNLNSNTTALVTKQNMLNGIKDRYEGYQFSVKKLMTASSTDKVLASKIKGVVASLVRTDKRYEVAIETSLGGALQNIVTATPEDAKYLIDYLKRTAGGRMTFLPISSMKPRTDSPFMRSAVNEKGAIGRAVDIIKYDAEYENVISNLLGNTLIVENTESGVIISKKYNFSFKVVTLDGDVLSTQGSMTGGSRKTDFGGFLSNDREIDELKDKIAVCRKDMDALNAEKNKLLAEVNEESDNLSELNDSELSARQDLYSAREKLSVIETALSEIGRNIENAQDAKDAVEAKIAALGEEMEKVSGGSDKLLSEKDTATKAVKESKFATENDKKRKEDILNEIHSLRITIVNNTNTKDGLKDDIIRLTNEIERLNGDNQLNRNNIENLEYSKKKLEEERQSVALTKEENALLESIKSEIEKIKDSKQRLSLKLSELEEKRQNLANELSVLTEQKSAQEIAFEQVESDVKYLEGKVSENYMLDYEGALKYKIEDFDVEKAISDAKEIREKIMSLGSINGAAIEEYASLNERYQSMLTQKQDIEKADVDLREGIDTLRQEILKTFNDGFKIINDNFSKIFKELFGGGKAMLELDYTDCEDPLEAGVEIRAEPPGKKLQKISLLSGGEQALTTIAILFAILKFNPMPFCVLDEIEAALDDANVGRFASYLKNFSKVTQFIVITHRKPTMELADSLFGVTMEEKGVSKTVSVKLSDAARFDADGR